MRKTIAAAVFAATLGAAYVHATESIELPAMTNVAHEQPNHIMLAQKSLASGERSLCLHYLSDALEEELSIYSRDLDYLTWIVEKAADKYEENPEMQPHLRKLAETLQNEHRLETAKQTLLDIFVQEDNKYGKDSIRYSLWLAYNYSIEETRSFDTTYKELTDYYYHRINDRPEYKRDFKSRKRR